MSAPNTAWRGRSAHAPEGRKRTAGIPGSPNISRRWLAAAGFIGLVAGVVPVSPASATTHPTGGPISTVAGSGYCGELVLTCSQYSGDGGAAISAKLDQPNSPVFDSNGIMYFADRGNDLVRKVVPGFDGVVNGGPGETITTVAAGTLENPTSLAIDSADNLLIADQGTTFQGIPQSGHHRVQYVNVGAVTVHPYGQTNILPGAVVTVAGNGTAGLTLSSPSGVAVDPANDDLYIADLGNRVVRKVTATGTASTVAGTGTAGFSGDGGTATSATLRAPMGVTVSGSALFITDQSNHNVRLVALGASVTANGRTVAAGNIDTVAGCSSACTSSTSGFSGDTGSARAALLNYPFSTAVDASGNLYISDEANDRVRVVTSGGTIYAYADDGTGAGEEKGDIYTQTGIDVCPPGGLVACGDGNDDGVAAADAELDNPRGVAVHSTSLYIADSRNQRVRRVSPIDTTP